MDYWLLIYKANAGKYVNVNMFGECVIRDARFNDKLEYLIENETTKAWVRYDMIRWR